MPGLQDWPADPHRSTHCRGLCLFTGAYDHRHFMTAMSTQSPKSRPNSSAHAWATGKPCLKPAFGYPDGAMPKPEHAIRHLQTASATDCELPLALSSSAFP